MHSQFKESNVPNEFGLFVNLDYAHKSQDECADIWHLIMNAMIKYGFSFEKRAFVIITEKNRDEIALEEQVTNQYLNQFKQLLSLCSSFQQASGKI